MRKHEVTEYCGVFLTIFYNKRLLEDQIEANILKISIPNTLYILLTGVLGECILLPNHLHFLIFIIISTSLLILLYMYTLNLKYVFTSYNPQLTFLLIVEYINNCIHIKIILSVSLFLTHFNGQ